MTIREEVLAILGLDRLLAADGDGLVGIMFVQTRPAPAPEGADPRYTMTVIGAVFVLPEQVPPPALTA